MQAKEKEWYYCQKKGKKIFKWISKIEPTFTTQILKWENNVKYAIKQGCQKTFIAKQPYLDPSFCHLVYPHGENKNQHGQICHGKDLLGYHHALGSQLSISMKAHLMGLKGKAFFLLK